MVVRSNKVIGMPYAMEFRVAVAKAHDELLSSMVVADMFGCTESWVRRLMRRQRETGSLAPLLAKHPDTRKLKHEDLEELRRLIETQPSLTLAELAAALGYKASVSTVWRATQKLDLVYKKLTRHASEQDRPDVKAARDVWFEQFVDVKAKQLVFIDEFGATTNMARTHGRGPCGERIVCKTPHGHWAILSTIAAMTIEGMITASTFHGPINAEAFEGFMEQFLVPELKPGQIVVLFFTRPALRHLRMSET
jgi:transposase